MSYLTPTPTRRLARPRLSGWPLRALASLALLALAAGVARSESADVSVPVSVSFWVTDITAPTDGAPDPTTVSFSNASLNGGSSLRISVSADSATFAVPGGGTAIPASALSWIASGAVGGAGSSGTVDSASYTQVYQSDANPSSGSVDLSWQLSALPAGVAAGDHTLTVRYRFESL